MQQALLRLRATCKATMQDRESQGQAVKHCGAVECEKAMRGLREGVVQYRGILSLAHRRRMDVLDAVLPMWVLEAQHRRAEAAGVKEAKRWRSTTLLRWAWRRLRAPAPQLGVDPAKRWAQQTLGTAMRALYRTAEEEIRQEEHQQEAKQQYMRRIFEAGPKPYCTTTIVTRTVIGLQR